MHLDRYFDAIYQTLNVLMVVGFVVTIVFGLLLRARRRGAAVRSLGAAGVLIAVGTAVALGGGLVADSALKSSPWFQQVRFGLYDLGFAVIVWGTISVIRGCAQPGSRRWLARALAIAYALAVIIGAVFVLVPQTFVLNQYHEQTQLAVYWLPLLVATAEGAIALFVVAGDGATALRARMRLVALFEALLFVGLLRESEILPDLGDPLLNLLVSFVPFVVGTVLLALSVRPGRAV